MEQRKALLLLRFLYPAWAVAGIFSLMYVPSQLIVHEDIARTAQNIAAHEFLFRSGIVGTLLTQLIFIFAALLLYRFFEKVHRDAAILMLVLALVGVPIAMLNALNLVAALFQVQNPEQMMFFLDLNTQGIIIAAIFWGLWLFPLGYLIYRSGYFPKIIGVGVILAGLGYTLGSFTKLLFPEMKALIAVCEPLTMGEVIWMLWLSVRGARW